MRRIFVLLAVAGLTTLVLGSCVRLLEPRPSNTQYYLLESARPGSTTTASDPGLHIGLRKPRVAEYLNTPGIVTRQGPNELHFSEFHRWAENLGPLINRVVAQNLAAQPGVQLVEVVPWPRGTTFDYVVQLRILRFEGVGPPPPSPNADPEPAQQGHSQMTVAWTVFGPEGDSVRTTGRTHQQLQGWPPADVSDLVSKLDSSLVVLTHDLHDKLHTLSTTN